MRIGDAICRRQLIAPLEIFHGMSSVIGREKPIIINNSRWYA
jgi:hypothetical protein